jgi:hypothetical protein
MALPPKPAAFPSISEELLYNIAESTGGGSSSSNLLFELENHTEFLGQIAQSLKDGEDNSAISLLLLISQHTATIKDNTLAIKDQNKLLSCASFTGSIPAANLSEYVSAIRLVHDAGLYELVVNFPTVAPNSPANRGILAAYFSAAFAGDVKLYETTNADGDWVLCFANVPLYYYDDGIAEWREIVSLKIDTNDSTYDIYRKNYRPIAL